jgi:hypothetical protein
MGGRRGIVMKRLLAIALCFLLSVVSAAAGTVTTIAGSAGGATLLASGSVTLANMKISKVDGTAFVDFSSAGALTDYNGSRLVIKDSASRELVGGIKDDGTGETYTEFITNGDFSGSGTGWTPRYDSWSFDGSKANCDGTHAYDELQQFPSIPINALYKWSIDLNRTSGDLLGFFSDTTPITTLFQITSGTTSTQSGYACKAGLPANSVIRIIPWTSAYVGSIDNVSAQQVLTPSAIGVTIVSAKGGATYNWTSMTSGFNLNDASNYTYEIWSE